jgi:hypothetical protein
MVNQFRTVLWLLLPIALLLYGPASAQGVGAANGDAASVAEFTVIAHPDVGVEDLDLDDLRVLLLGNQRFWPGGLRVHLVIDGRRDGAARRAWIRDVTGMTDVQHTQYWIGMVFRGRATTAPHAVPDTATALALVASLPGAISIIDASPSTDQVQVLGLVDDLLAER